jgi:hypothetical protein
VLAAATTNAYRPIEEKPWSKNNNYDHVLPLHSGSCSFNPWDSSSLENSFQLFKILPDDFVATVRLALAALATFF